MQETSRAFQRAIRSDGRRKSVISVTESFGSSYIFENIPLMDGNITVDRNADVRRSGWIKVGEKSLTDVFFTNHAGPFGMEIEVYHGIVFPNGTEEYVKMGVFNVDGFSWEEGDGGWPVIQLYDRSMWIQRAPFISARNFSGVLAQDVITQIVEEVIPEVTIVFEEGLENPRLPGGSIFDDDRWTTIKSACATMGAEAYFDANGVMQVKLTRDPTATAQEAVWEFNVDEGFSELQSTESGGSVLVRRPQGTLIAATRSISRTDTYNGVVVYGAAPSSSAGQPYALAFDNDPQSPTYFEGPFGQSVKRVDNQLLTTTIQCTEAATSELKSSLGFARSIEFTAIGNPALDEGDYIVFTFSNGSQEVHMLDSFSYPLGPGTFSGATRTNPVRQTASIGFQRGSSGTAFAPKAPGKPVLLSATTTSITLQWTAAVAGSSALKEYVVLVNSSPSKTVDAALTSTTISGLSTGKSYAFTVKAFDDAGQESALSPVAYLKTAGTGTVDPTPDPVKTYTKRYTATWSRTYTGGGDAATWHGNDVHQGVVSGGNGNYRSLIGFDSARIRADTSGAAIVGCRVFLYYKHWYKNSGGTAILGTHGYSSRPGSWSNGSVSQDRVRSSGWPKPGGRWVNLGATIGNNFRSGAARGVAVGPAPSSSTTYYGVARGAGSGSLTPVLEITYRK